MSFKMKIVGDYTKYHVVYERVYDAVPVWDNTKTVSAKQITGEIYGSRKEAEEDIEKRRKENNQYVRTKHISREITLSEVTEWI